MNGRGERDNHLILLGPEVGYHQTHAHTIKGLPSAVDVSTLQPALTEKKRSRSASLPGVRNVTCTHLVHGVSFPAAVAAS